ncbi:hypothetical protein X975_12262, partial [Stegodyphus mimosarum]
GYTTNNLIYFHNFDEGRRLLNHVETKLQKRENMFWQ